VARDRRRAKQRRERGAAAGDGRRGKGAGAVAPSQPLRGDVPGSLDHASGEVDEFDAALVRGARGLEAAPEDVEAAEAETELGGGGEDLLQEPAPSDVRAGARGAVAEREEHPSGGVVRGGNKVVGFLRASWAELQRVQWPDRRQVTQATAVVLGFVAVAGAYLGLADFVAKEIVEFIL
jgi:preprotein translocase subunit SecE